MDFSQTLARALAHALKAFDLFLFHLGRAWVPHANRRTFILLVSTLFLWGAFVFFTAPPSRFPTHALVTIPSGATLEEAATILEEEGFVRSARIFSLFVYLNGAERSVHAGDYTFAEPQSLFGVAYALSEGIFGLVPVRVRVPEGITVREIADLFAKDFPRFDKERFIREALPDEGYLFPDTYFFMPNATDKEVHAALRNAFDTRTKFLTEKIESFGRPLADVVVMASLLEREAHRFEDRRAIAGVLWNRIDINMRLQVDAAFLYTLGKATFDLTREDLSSDDPYNTYRNVGLPPTPIGSPSLSSLEAAVTPIKHEYLFYLADMSGVTHYSKTFEEHVSKKKKYLQ
jgi:UPF0755 protein